MSRPAWAPHYVFAAPLGVQPHPVGPKMKKIGPNLWAIEINITHQMSSRTFWTLGVQVGTTLHLIHIQLHTRAAKQVQVVGP